MKLLRAESFDSAGRDLLFGVPLPRSLLGRWSDLFAGPVRFVPDGTLKSVRAYRVLLNHPWLKPICWLPRLDEHEAAAYNG